MQGSRNLKVLFLGVVLIGLGGALLAYNFLNVDVDWVLVLKIVVPALLLWAGGAKLLRHLFWSEEEIARRPSKAGLLGGIFWSALGAVILLDIGGVLETIDFIGLYWPVAMIVYGAGKVVDYYRFQGRLQFRTAEFFGLVFIVAFGFACNRISSAHFPLLDWDLGRDDWPVPIKVSGAKYTFTAQRDEDSQGISVIVVKNLYGNVRIEGAPEEGISIELTKQIQENSESDAREISDQLVISSQRDGETLMVGTNREDLGEKGSRLNTALALRVPTRISVKVQNSYGDIKIEELDGPCTLETTYGSVSAASLRGDLEINAKYKPVKASNVTGSVRVSNARGPIQINGVTGNVDVVNEYDSVECTEVNGNVLIRNQFGTVDVSRVQGEVDIDAPGSRIQIEEVQKSVSLSSSHKPVTVKRVAADLTIVVSYADINLEDVGGAADLKADHADLFAERLEGGARVEARASRVRVNEVVGPLNVATSLREVSIREFRGPVTVQNEYGDVVLATSYALTDPISVSNLNGQIDLTVPENAGFRLSAQAKAGEIVSDFGPKPKSGEEDTRYLDTTVGPGGPTVELQTAFSRIRVQKRG